MRPFGEVLRHYRERRRLSQSRLGRRAGYDASYVSRLESGERAPGRETVRDLCDILGLLSEQRAELFLAGGYAPDREGDLVTFVVENLGGSPALELARFMADPSEPEPSKQAVRRAVLGMVRHG